MKIIKIFIVTVFSILLFGGAANASSFSKPIQAYSTDIRLQLYGFPVNKEVIVVEGSSYLPVRAISEALGLVVSWDGNARIINLYEDDNADTFNTDRSDANVNTSNVGTRSSRSIRAYSTDIKLQLYGFPVNKEVIVVEGSSYLPVRAISEALGLEVDWDGDTRIINLYKNNVDSNVEKEAIDVSGRWTTSNGTVLQLQQNKNIVTGTMTLYESLDATQWPTPVEGKIEGSVLTLDIKWDNEFVIKKWYKLPDDHLFLFSILNKGVSDRLELEISSDKLSGTIQSASIWYHTELFPFLDKIANGGSPENPADLKDVTFTQK